MKSSLFISKNTNNNEYNKEIKVARRSQMKMKFL